MLLSATHQCQDCKSGGKLATTSLELNVSMIISLIMLNLFISQVLMMISTMALFLCIATRNPKLNSAGA